MQEAISLWPLIGIAVIVVGFVLRFNPVLVVIISGIVTGVAAHMPIATILEKLGEGFLNTRNLPFILLLPLAVIGLLERHGLKERAQAWIAKIHSATAGRLLIVYLFVREATAALGLTSLGGHPQMVRPLLAPMAEGAAEKRFGPLPGNVRYRLRAMSAATDNVGLFFGEDIFVAFGAIIFMHNFMLESGGIQTEPLHIALWGIPTAICAFLIHAARLWRLDRHLQRELDRINVGQAGGRVDITVERVAINVDDARIPDNKGQQPIDEPIVANGPAACFSTLPIKAIVSALRQQGIPASVSQTAGTFVCNHVMYGLLHQLQGKSGQKGGFIHIPYLPEQAAAHPGQASMSVATVRAALETAIAVALEQDDDVKIGGGATH